MLLRIQNVLRLCPTASVLKSRRFCSARSIQVGLQGVYEDAFPSNSVEEIQKLAKSPPQCIYAGFDPTANSLHIGNLLILMNLLHWQRAGHQVIILLGGATGQIGDPSHRLEERMELDSYILSQNLTCIQRNLETISENHSQLFCRHRRDLRPFLYVNNIHWYKKVYLIPFIKDIGRHFRMGTMLGRSSVQCRLKSESGMSFTEFCYSIFQAYDWLHLYKNYGCRFQLGGSDQMGNIVAGYDLVSKFAKEQVFGLTTPLITAEGGKKFGKSTGNAVWLSPEKSSSFRLYQFFIRSTDADVGRYLRMFTFLEPKRVQEIVEEHRRSPEKREAQKILAEQVTLLVHGECGLEKARTASAALYDTSVDSLSQFSPEDLTDIFHGADTIEMYPSPGLTVLEIALKAGCFKTESEAVRIITAGGFYINNNRAPNIHEVLVDGIHILRNDITLLRVGKRRYFIVRWL